MKDAPPLNGPTERVARVRERLQEIAARSGPEARQFLLYDVDDELQLLEFMLAEEQQQVRR